MHFASFPPLWLAVLVVAGICAAAYLTYRRPLVPLSGGQRVTLSVLRGLALAAIVVLLWRPVLLVPRASDAVIPILVDVSRSMRIPDADGRPRLEAAIAALEQELIPSLSRRFRPEIYTFGESLAASPSPTDDIGGLAATARQTDLSGALDGIRDRFRGRRIAGVVLLTDGGDTGRLAAGTAPSQAGGPAIFAVGVGATTGGRDREVLGVVAGDPRLDQAAIDLHVSAVSHGYGREPFELQLLANGAVVDSRRPTPAAEGSPVGELFSVLPNPFNATVYTVRIAAADDETAAENNGQTILLNPVGRKRKVLALQGAPGYDHSFLTRALSRDPGLELDAVVRKGRNESGQHTFFVQAAADRAASLTQGFPPSREALYQYDAIIVANIEGDFFTRTQLASIAEFAGHRGGGVLLLGGQSFAQKGIIGTPLEEVLPVELNDRRSPLSRAAVGDVAVRQNAVSVTPEGERHPVMRIGADASEVRQRWAALPALAASAPLGGPRPGASILAVTAASGGISPVIAVQRYGAGRSMVFAGEASWRWRMMLPASDQTYDHFWRQAVRWLAGAAPDPVSITLPDSPEPGDAVTIAVDIRDSAFEPVPDAAVRATVTLPGGETQDLALKRDAGVSGRSSGAWRPDAPGLYRVEVAADRGRTKLGAADRWFYVGGRDREFADPRLNEGVLRRIARSSGGSYLPIADVGDLVSSLESAVPAAGEPIRRDLWHEPWAFLLIVLLLSAEWTLRRRWGLR